MERLLRLSRVWPALLALAIPEGAAPIAAAQEISVAAASDLQSVLPELAARFRGETGCTVRLSFGSSGTLFSQIQNGAPFDLFFSADSEYPRKLEAAGLAEPGSLYRYATGRIVVWVRSDSRLDVSRGLSILLDPAVHRIAVANPAHAPYGRAAVAALEHEHLYDRVRDRLVFGENVSQAAQFVQSGNADAGIVALSLALAPALKTAGVFYEIPGALYPPIDQGVVIVNASSNKDAAHRFLTFLRTPAVVQLMRSFGFTPS